MTSSEFQTATDLQRVRTIKAELDALEASENVGDIGDDATRIGDVDLMKMRKDVRLWEATLLSTITIKAPRSDAGRSRKAADAPLLDGQS